MRIMLILLLMAGVAHADQRDVDFARQRNIDKGLTDLTLVEETQLLTRGWRDKRRGEEGVPVTRYERPPDYTNSRHRGTLVFDPRWHNYAYHKVKIPNGTIIDGTQRGYNFSQIAPVTDSILREPGFGENLTFIRCNLVNVRSYPDWTITDSNTSQVDRLGVIQTESRNQSDSHDTLEVEFVARRSQDVPDVRVKPGPRIIEGRNAILLE